MAPRLNRRDFLLTSSAFVATTALIGRNGLSVSYSRNGAIHSGGRSVQYTRDGQDRIVQVRDQDTGQAWIQGLITQAPQLLYHRAAKVTVLFLAAYGAHVCRQIAVSGRVGNEDELHPLAVPIGQGQQRRPRDQVHPAARIHVGALRKVQGRGQLLRRAQQAE